MGENKKKSGRAAVEEEDLDAILAELEGAPFSNLSSPSPDEMVHSLPELADNDVQVSMKEVEGKITESALAKKKKKKKENHSLPELAHNDVQVSMKEVEGKITESALAKKKKKKKEKEIQKKVAAAVAAETKENSEEVKSKVLVKKVPKHVREMQEALARRKEAEEKKKREEQEKQREEEERKRQEELEKFVAEAKRQKKEREKEKLLRKKQEGRLLTGKQKDVARRLEAMRNQNFAQGGILPSADTVSKRPKFERRKPKTTFSKVHGGFTTKAEEKINKKTLDGSVQESELAINVDMEDVVPAVVEVEEGTNVIDGRDEEEDNDVEWDLKSWDDTNIIALPVKSNLVEEEVIKEEPKVKKVEISKCRIPPSITNSVDSTYAPLAIATEVAKKIAFVDHKRKHTTEGKDLKVEAPAMGDNKQEAAKGTQVQAPVTHKSGEEAVKSHESIEAGPLSQRKSYNLRSPICCILGHVDSGKTRLLDFIRGTSIQEGEAGGITQKIGATYVPVEHIREKTNEFKVDADFRVPGLLLIDTPGHESFANMHSRGSALCDIIILVVDIMHGLQQQTLESLNQLKLRDTQFIVALHKVDRLYGWKTCPNIPIMKAMKQQSADVHNEFKMRLKQIIMQFMEQGLNTELCYKNRDMGQTYNIVPTSAITGEGIPDLLLLLVQ